MQVVYEERNRPNGIFFLISGGLGLILTYSFLSDQIFIVGFTIILSAFIIFGCIATVGGGKKGAFIKDETLFLYSDIKCLGQNDEIALADIIRLEWKVGKGPDQELFMVTKSRNEIIINTLNCGGVRNLVKHLRQHIDVDLRGYE